ncbi:MAG: hypothetical protein IJ200_12905 [Prevotella sp.]|nr:hypothetical protein [Prevotella sp.]
MKKVSENATVTFEPEVINEHTKVTFTKVSNAKGVTIYGKVEKDNAEVGSISYEQSGNFLITSLKPLGKLTKEEVSAIYENVPTWVGEATGEEATTEE